MHIGKQARNDSGNTRLGVWTVALALALIAAGALWIAGCESKPAEPVFENPFDADGPLAGTPMDIQATRGDSLYTVTWQQLPGYGISAYDVIVSTEYDSGYEFWQSFAPTTQPRAFAQFPIEDHDQAYYFGVTAFTNSGDFSLTNYQDPDAVVTPQVVAGAGNKLTASRYLTLNISVTRGDELLVANNRNFIGAVTAPVAELYAVQQVVLDLGTATADHDTLRYYVQATSSGWESPVVEGWVRTLFGPEFSVENSSTTVATRNVILTVPPEGVQQARFAATAEDLETEAWSDFSGDPTYELEDTLLDQTIYGQFRGDLGYDSPVLQATVSGDLMTDATCTADVDGATADPVVRMLCDAVATQVRIGEADSFAGAAWHAYADTVYTTLSAGSGRKTLYIQFRNEFTDSPLLTEVVDFGEQPLAVGFYAPAPNTELSGGTSYQMRGWAFAATGGAPVDSVKLDLEDGSGWIRAEGLEEWTLWWDVPAVDIETGRTLRARAWAGADSVTTTLPVMIDP